ncbi:MAG TPA: hypothetical protein VE631_02860 [Alphaproteobacteria bacterium]|nr:hypothetical protein [Alphaproteobacteria bacterium]
MAKHIRNLAAVCRDLHTAKTIFVLWLLALGVLAILPGAGVGEDLGQATAVYYAYTHTNTVLQDVDGTVSVQVPGLRPVVPY